MLAKEFHKLLIHHLLIVGPQTTHNHPKLQVVLEDLFDFGDFLREAVTPRTHGVGNVNEHFLFLGIAGHS
jgi:hypothetical protein